jgi:hypothetical protein
MGKSTAMRTARECVIVLNGFFMDVPSHRPIPRAFSGIDLKYQEENMYDALHALVILNHPVPADYRGTRREYVELWFDESNLLKMELAFTGQKEGRAWDVLSAVWHKDADVLFESLRIFHTWYPNPIHRLRALLYQLMEQDGIFQESWNLVWPSHRKP